jgi:hypothetical protein
VTVLRFYSGTHWSAWVTPGGVRTIFYDGSECFGSAPESEAFLQSARALGYEDDIYAHMVEHDLVHHLMAQGIDGAPSASLWNQSHDPKAYARKLWKRPWLQEAVERDEWRVGAMQAALNGKSWGHDRLIELYGYSRSRNLVATIEDNLRPRGEAMTWVWACERAKRIEAGEREGPVPVGWKAPEKEAA